MEHEWDEQGDFHPGYGGRKGVGVGAAVAREQQPGSDCRRMGGDPLQHPPLFEGRVRPAALEVVGRAGGAGYGSASTASGVSASVVKSRVGGWSRVSEKLASEEQKERTAEVTDPEEEEEEEEEEMQRTTYQEDGSAGGRDPITRCSLCGKSFPSRKSLYGHMRCHPEREWRGIKPPPGARIGAPPSSSSSPSGSSVVPLILAGLASDPQYWPGWSITQKRGRKGTKHHSPVRSSCVRDNHDDPMVAAVSSLLHIAEGGFKLGAPQYVKPDQVLAAEEMMIHEEEADVSADGQPSSVEPADADHEPEKPAILFFDVVEQPELVANGDINGDSEEHDLDALAENRNSKRKMRELKTLREVGGGAAAGRKRRYKCNTCNKCFPTHQALGGHRASHRKEKSAAPVEEAAGDDPEPAAAPPPLNTAPAVLLPNLVVHKASSALAEHRCDKCSMVFTTGQALGGHKRKHWSGHEGSVAAAPAKGNAESTVIILRDFDLNERPQDGLEEEF